MNYEQCEQFYERYELRPCNYWVGGSRSKEWDRKSELVLSSKRSGATCHMAMPQCCYLAKGAKRPSHATNTIKFDRIPFDPCISIKRFDLCPFDQKNSTYLQPPVIITQTQILRLRGFGFTLRIVIPIVLIRSSFFVSRRTNKFFGNEVNNMCQTRKVEPTA